MIEIKDVKDIDIHFLMGMIFQFCEKETKLSKTDLRVFYEMYCHSDKYNYFSFDEYSEVSYIFKLDKSSFSRSIKRLVASGFIEKTDNNFKLIAQIPF